MTIESKKIKVDVFIEDCAIRNQEIAVPFNFNELSPKEKREIIVASIVDKIPIKYGVKK